MSLRVMAVGAFERDNFGDILFYEITRRLVAPLDIDLVPASIVEAALPSGQAVRGYGWERPEDWDGVWVVGGEVGGLTVDDALHMSLDGAAGTAYRYAEAGARAILCARATGLDLSEPAYLPHALASQLPLVINSVGLARIGGRKNESLFPLSLDVVSSAKEVVVREEASRAFLNECGVTAILEPDMVHSISTVDGLTRKEVRGRSRGEYVLLQASDAWLAPLEPGALRVLAAQLAAAAGAPVVLFLAGTARGHDSLAAYERALGCTVEEAGLAVASGRDPVGLAMTIARARAWVGTSLHGRIVASAYGVPRVSLANQKVAAYAASWDPAFPSGIDVGGAAGALLEAAAFERSATERDRSEELSHRARKSTMRVAGRLM